MSPWQKISARLGRRGIVLVAAALGLLALLFALQQLAASLLKSEVLRALGSESTVRATHLGWNGVVIEGLSIRAPKGWPAPETLRAERVTVVPELRSLFSDEVRIARIHVEQAYLSMLRPRRGGVRVLPNLVEKPRTDDESAAPPPRVLVAHIELDDAVLEFYDASVRRPALKLRVEQLQATLDDLVLPALDRRMQLAVDGVVKGPQRDGRLEISGWLLPASRDSSIRTSLQDIDLKALEPYLLQASEAGVRRGTLSMELQSEVKRNRLNAPGTMTLTQLELASGGGIAGSFMGMPRSAVIAALRDRDGRIELRFTLEGDLANPEFALNESLSRRLAYGAAEGLGLGLADLAKGVGSLGGKGLGAVGDAAKGLGKAVGGLFGGGDDEE